MIPFGPENAVSSAALAPSTAKPTGFLDNIESSWNAMRKVELSDSRSRNMGSLVDQQFEKLQQHMPTGDTRVLAMRGIDRSYESSSPERQFELLQPIIAKLVQQNPELKDEFFSSMQDIEKFVNEQALKAYAENEETLRSATTGGAIGNFLGAGGAFMTDPTVLMTLPFGGPLGQGVKGTLTFAMREAGLAAIGETAAQPFIQQYKKELGLDHGFEEAMKNIALAGTFGAGFGLLLGGGVGAVRKFTDALKKSNTSDSPTVRRALEEADQQAIEAEATPFTSNAPEARAAHRINVQEAVRSVMAEKMPSPVLNAGHLREDLRASTALSRIQQSVEFELDVDLSGMGEIGALMRRSDDLTRSEDAIKQLNELEALDSSQSKQIGIVRDLEMKVQRLNRELISVVSELAHRGGRGRKGTVDEIAREIEPQLTRRVEALEKQRDTYRRWLKELDNPRIKKANAEADKMTASILKLEERLGKASAKNRKKLQREIDEMRQKRFETIDALADVDTPDMVRVRQSLIDVDEKLRDLAVQRTELRQRAEAQAKADTTKLETMRETLEAELANVHAQRRNNLENVQFRATDVSGPNRANLPPNSPRPPLRDGATEARLSGPEAPEVRPGARAREAEAVVTYERVVAQNAMLDEISEADWAEAKSVLAADPKKSYMFDELDELGDLRVVPKSGERIEKEIAEQESFLKELEACIAGPGT